MARNLTIDDIRKEKGRGLAFEVAALRDIAPGEDFLFDYGPEWEEAWAAHVAGWSSSPMLAEPWPTAKDANENTGPIFANFLSGDLRKTIDHPYLFTGCQY